MRRFVARVEERALGTAVLKGVKPEQQLVKVVNDSLIDLMGGKASGLVEGGPGRPQVLLMRSSHSVTKKQDAEPPASHRFCALASLVMDSNPAMRPTRAHGCVVCR